MNSIEDRDIPQPDILPPEKRNARCRRVRGALVTVLAAVLAGGCSASPHHPGEAVASRGRGPLKLEQLPLSSLTVVGAWEQERFLIAKRKQAWFASACVVARDAGVLVIVTNAHVLELGSLTSEAGTGVPEIVAYELAVIFPTGKRATVASFRPHPGGADVAVLYLSAAHLSDGEEYVISPPEQSSGRHIGEEVVAVGSPLGLPGTVTVGHVSAYREIEGVGHCIQTDAAINPGNSGGPVFARRGGGYRLIGLSVATMGAPGLNLAVAVEEIKAAVEGTRPRYWATPSGAAQAIARLYGKIATVVPGER